jgi:hypothetical protein
VDSIFAFQVELPVRIDVRVGGVRKCSDFSVVCIGRSKPGTEGGRLARSSVESNIVGGIYREGLKLIHLDRLGRS